MAPYREDATENRAQLRPEVRPFMSDHRRTNDRAGTRWRWQPGLAAGLPCSDSGVGDTGVCAWLPRRRQADRAALAAMSDAQRVPHL